MLDAVLGAFSGFTYITALAVLAGSLQILGYGLYIGKTLRHEVEPNPTTWFMFAYGTSLLAFLEWDRDASPELLFLPVTCAALGIVVAFLCWKRGTLKWPEKKIDRAAFMVDVSLTVAYLVAWGALLTGYITPETKELLAMAFLVCTNLSTIVSFVPLIRSTAEEPEQEDPLPWIVWCLAYSTLGITTFLQGEGETELMIYPVLNAFLHGLIAAIALIAQWVKTHPRPTLSA